MTVFDNFNMPRKSERLFRIYQRLKTIPQTIDELYRWSQHVDLGLSKRSLYRYLEELELAVHEPGFELVITNNDAKERRWHVVKSKRTSDRKRKEGIRSFYFLKNLSGRHLNALSSHYLETIEQELNENNEPEHHDGLLYDHLIVTGWSEANYSTDDEIMLRHLLSAIERKEYVVLELITHLSAEPPVNGVHEWAVHYLVSHRGTLYVAVSKRGSRQFQFLDIDSIRSVKSTLNRFRTHPKKHVVLEELSKRFGITAGNGPAYKVTVMFHATLDGDGHAMKNPFIEKRSWHPTQRFSHDKDGNVILQFRSQLNRELLGWLFMWLDHIRIIGPPQLIRLARKKLCDMEEVFDGREPLNSRADKF